MSVDGCSQPSLKSQGLWLSSVTPQHGQDTRWNSLLYHWEIMCWHLLSNKVLLKHKHITSSCGLFYAIMTRGGVFLGDLHV